MRHTVMRFDSIQMWPDIFSLAYGRFPEEHMCCFEKTYSVSSLQGSYSMPPFYKDTESGVPAKVPGSANLLPAPRVSR